MSELKLSPDVEAHLHYSLTIIHSFKLLPLAEKLLRLMF